MTLLLRSESPPGGRPAKDAQTRGGDRADVRKAPKNKAFAGSVPAVFDHLKDRSMDPRFATLLGYTPDELDGALRENVEALGAQNGMSVSRRT